MIVRHGQVGDWRCSDEEFLRTFRLPTARDKVEVLKERHPLVRDSRISFDEESHTHSASGTSLSLSYTQWAAEKESGGLSRSSVFLAV